MHLQDAYYAEKNETGNGDQIGYKAPASNNFDYTVTGGGAADAVWGGKSTTNLDDCGTGSEWKVTSSKQSTGSGAKHVAAAPDVGGICESLTPSFTSIGAGTTH